MSQAKFDGPGSTVALEHQPAPAALKPAPRIALSLLRDLDGATRASPWRHWIVGVEPIGRITLPVDARRVLDVESSVQAIIVDGALILRCDGGGARVLVDHRGRLVLPMWLRGAIEPAGSVLVAARSSGVPTVLVAPAALLDALVDNAFGECR